MRERTTILLSAFINFVKFAEQYCDTFLKDLRERSDALIIQRDNVTNQENEIQEQIDTIKCVRIKCIQFLHLKYDSGLELKKKSQFWRSSMLRTLP